MKYRPKVYWRRGLDPCGNPRLDPPVFEDGVSVDDDWDSWSGCEKCSPPEAFYQKGFKPIIVHSRDATSDILCSFCFRPIPSPLEISEQNGGGEEDR
jgi:hypothetical protein